MNWIHVNFYTRNCPETFCVSETDFDKKKPQPWLKYLFILFKVGSYIPTSLGLLSYFLFKENNEKY